MPMKRPSRLHPRSEHEAEVVESLAALFSASEFNLVQYWLAAFDMWLDMPDNISFKDLTITEGMALRELVPHPDQVVEWLSFREAKSASL